MCGLISDVNSCDGLSFGELDSVEELGSVSVSDPDTLSFMAFKTCCGNLPPFSTNTGLYLELGLLLYQPLSCKITIVSIIVHQNPIGSYLHIPIFGLEYIMLCSEMRLYLAPVILHGRDASSAGHLVKKVDAMYDNISLLTLSTLFIPDPVLPLAGFTIFSGCRYSTS